MLWEFIDIRMPRFMVLAIWPAYVPPVMPKSVDTAVYTTPYLDLMQEAIASFGLSEACQEKKESLFEWFRSQEVICERPAESIRYETEVDAPRETAMVAGNGSPRLRERGVSPCRCGVASGKPLSDPKIPLGSTPDPIPVLRGYPWRTKLPAGRPFDSIISSTYVRLVRWHKKPTRSRGSEPCQVQKREAT